MKSARFTVTKLCLSLSKLREFVPRETDRCDGGEFDDIQMAVFIYNASVYLYIYISIYNIYIIMYVTITIIYDTYSRIIYSLLTHAGYVYILYIYKIV